MEMQLSKLLRSLNMTFQEKIDKLNRMIAEARHIVFFTGAGSN